MIVGINNQTRLLSEKLDALVANSASSSPLGGDNVDTQTGRDEASSGKRQCIPH